VWSSLPCYHPPASRASLLDAVGLGKHEAHCGGSEVVRLKAVRQGCGRPARGETGSCGRSLATEELPPFLLAGTWSSLSSPHLRAHAPVEGGSMADQRATCARAPAPHSMEACPATGEPSTSAPPPPAAMGPRFEARWRRHLGRPTSWGRGGAPADDGPAPRRRYLLLTHMACRRWLRLLPSRRALPLDPRLWCRRRPRRSSSSGRRR
jgi:hypothetical protein